MNILVTGATGLLGRETFREALRSFRGSAKVVGTCHRRSAPGCERIDLSVPTDIPPFLNRLAPDVILHTAAERHPDASQQDPEGTRRLNVEATRALGHWAARHHALLVYISTDYVFDGTNPPYRPLDKPHPVNAYGESKLAGETALLEESPGDSVILRVPILFGPCSDWGESAVTVLAKKMLAAPAGASLRMDDWATRYPTFTPDVAIVLRQIAERGIADSSFRGIYHWSGSEPFTKYGMTRVMAKTVGFDTSRLVPDPDPPAGAPRPKDAHLDTAALEALGIGRRTPFAAAVAAVLGK
jgi:dTDP-4-dehydrorhamnose reductase